MAHSVGRQLPWSQAWNGDLLAFKFNLASPPPPPQPAGDKLFGDHVLQEVLVETQPSDLPLAVGGRIQHLRIKC